MAGSLEVSLNLVALGALTGSIYAVLGWLKSKRPFNARKFGQTVALGAVVGALAPFAGIEVNEATVETYASITGLIVLVQTILQGLWRRGGGDARRLR